MTPETYRWARDLVEARDPLGALKLIGPHLEGERGNHAVELLAARAYYGSAQLGKAETAFRALLERDPGDAWVLHALGRTLERSGRGEEAAPYFRLAAAMRPDDPEYTGAAARYAAT